LKITIPNRIDIHITNIILDFNGTLAIDGKIIAGVTDNINVLSKNVDFYVVTADTNGTVEKELAGTSCQIINLATSMKYQSKLDVLIALGKETTLCIGNGYNDREVLKQAILGIAIMQEECIATEALLAADMLCSSISDAFSCLNNTHRLVATLRG